MPIDPNIALSIRPPQIENPLNAMLRVQGIRRAQQEDQLNAMKMEQMQRQVAQQEQIRNALMGGASLEDVARLSGDPAAVSTVLANSARAGASEATANKAMVEQSLIEFERFVQDEPTKQAWIQKWSMKLPSAAAMANVPYSDEMKQAIVLKVKDRLTLAQGDRRVAASERVATAAERRAAAAEAAAKGSPDIVARTSTDDKGTVHFYNAKGEEISTAEGAGKSRDTPEAKLSAKDRAQRDAAYPKATAALNASTRDLDTLIGKVDELAKHPGLSNITGPVAGRTPNITPEATGAQAILDSIRAAGALAKITELRQNSPTGGALGNVSDRDIMLLKDAAATLAQSQGTPEFERHLADYKKLLEQTKRDIQDAYALDYEYRNTGQIPEDALKVPKEDSGAAGMSDDDLKKELGL